MSQSCILSQRLINIMMKSHLWDTSQHDENFLTTQRGSPRERSAHSYLNYLTKRFSKLDECMERAAADKDDKYVRLRVVLLVINWFVG